MKRRGGFVLLLGKTVKAQSRRRADAGFSLIELMIVISIIGITLMLAVPSYENFTTRAKLTEAISATATYKLEVAEYMSFSPKFPVTKNSDVFKTIRDPSKYIRMIKFRRPNKNVFYIEVWPSRSVNASLGKKKALLLRGLKTGDAGNIRWECGTYGNKGRKIPYVYLPASCRQDMSWKGKV